jgi:type V secretory pathway adhesin AidA
VTGSVLPRQQGESADQWYVRVNIAGAAAAAGDIFLLQNESNTTSGGQYAYMFNATQGQAQAANGNVRAFSEVSTANGTAAQMATAAQSISPAGVYVAAAGNMAQTDQFFQLMKTAGY